MYSNNLLAACWQEVCFLVRFGAILINQDAVQDANCALVASKNSTLALIRNQ